MSNIPARIDALREKFHARGSTECDRTFDGWLKEYETAFLTDNLGNHSAIKMLIARFETDIRGMNERLQSEDSTTLPDSKRDRLMDKRNFYSAFISLFLQAGDKLRDIDKRVKENENVNKNI